ncbi:hypothetical protein VaNZ11_015789, partial [Volvox africanus]
MFGQEAKLAALINRDPAQVPNEQALVTELRAKLGPGADPGKLLFQIRSARGKTHWAVNSYLRDVMTSSTPGQEDFRPSRPARTTTTTTTTTTAAAAAAAAAATTTAANLPSSSMSPTATGIATAITDADAESDLLLPGGPREPPSSVITDCLEGRLDRSKSTAAEISTESVGAGDGGSGSGCSGSGCSCSCLGAPGLDSLPVSLLEAVFRHLDYRSLCAAAMASRAMSLAASSESLWSALYASRWGRVVFPTEPHLGL